MMNKILYHIVYAGWYLLAKLPSCIHYFNARWIAFLLCYVVCYRKKVIRKNVKDSFPELSDAERNKIVHDFYTHFCNVLVESLMYFGFTEKDIEKRIKFDGIEEVRERLAKGTSICVYLGHYANWEWGASISLYLKDICTVAQLYHPLENKAFDKVIGESRERFGGKNIPVESSIKEIMRYRSMGKPIFVGFIADQVPHWPNIHLWVPFLNHPNTPVFTGAERIARKCEMAVYYFDMKRIKPGYYHAELKLMAENAKETPENSMTELYCKLLEETIRREPALWLWSHNRWKRTREVWEQKKANGTL